MRLIDADALIERLETSHAYHARTSREEVLLYRDIRIIGEQPTIDAVPVVRCKDCKHGKTWKNAFGIEGFKCDLLCVDLSPEAFCSYGQRKDGANDGKG